MDTDQATYLIKMIVLPYISANLDLNNTDPTEQALKTLVSKARKYDILTDELKNMQQNINEILEL